jgi:hypothetical protein
MAKKGKVKNGRNKAIHSKLMKRKTTKLRKEKELRAEKLKAIIKNSKEIPDN